jgi:hypothetical protein
MDMRGFVWFMAVYAFVARLSWAASCNRRATAVLRGSTLQRRRRSLLVCVYVVQTAENLIALTAEAASRIVKLVSQCKICVDLEKEFCMSLETHLAALGQRHDALDKEIEKELAYPAKDDLKLAEMKRRKLQLKDEIAKLQCDRPSPSMH